MDILKLVELPYPEARKIIEEMMSVGELPLEHKMYYSYVNNNYSSPENRIDMIGFFRKNAWRDRYPDLQRMADAMEPFRTDELLLEYAKGIPPPSIFNRAVNVYKKCISFRAKIKPKDLSDIRRMYYQSFRLCIDREPVQRFLNEFSAWNSRAYDLWYEVNSAKNDFFHNSSRRYTWKYIVGDSERMKSVADELGNLLQRTRLLLKEGRQLVASHDALISLEYEQNASEMSLYEREREIERTACADDASDEQYCYVYTLECSIGVFYVGIAADPKDRYEQHIRAACSDEERLFKSKIIRKYGKDVRQKVIYEGTRRECKQKEKEYIAEHSPLGNMTAGGEG